MYIMNNSLNTRITKSYNMEKIDEHKPDLVIKAIKIALNCVSVEMKKMKKVVVF